MDYSNAKYSSYDNDPPEERIGCFRTRCRKCDWEDEETYLYRSDCEISECPECESTDVEDINEDD